MTVVRLKQGDPPPFWNGLWHSRGNSEGAVLVRDGVIVAASEAETTPIVAPAASASRQPVVGTPEANDQPAAPVTSPRNVTASVTGVSQNSETAANVTAKSETTSVTDLATGPHHKGDAARTWVAQLVSRSMPSRPTVAPVSRDVQQGAALVQEARMHVAQRQWVNALKCLQASLDYAPAQSDTYLLMAQCLQASRASGDALHHAVVAVMLNPREARVQRLVMHYAWLAGYVGWAFHWAQLLFRQTPTADVADLGRMSRAWLTSQSKAQTAFCLPCGKPQLLDTHSRCGTCHLPLVGAPANAQALKGILLLQHAAPNGRLFVGAPCHHCQRDTTLILGPGGARCAQCHEFTLHAHPPAQV